MAKAKIDVGRLRERIREHLIAFGDTKWRDFDRPQSISMSMFRRYVRQERERLIERGTLEPSQPKLLQDQIDKRRAESVKKAVANDHADFPEPINLMDQATQMLRYCDALDREAATVDEAGTVTVKDAAELREAIKTRSAVLRLAVDAQERLYGTTRIMRVHRAMFQRITETDPEVARRIMADLSAIDREYGIALQ